MKTSNIILPPVEMITDDIFKIEASEEMVAIFRDRMRGEPGPNPSLMSPEEQSAHNHAIEAKMRKKAGIK